MNSNTYLKGKLIISYCYCKNKKNPFTIYLIKEFVSFISIYNGPFFTFYDFLVFPKTNIFDQVRLGKFTKLV